AQELFHTDNVKNLLLPFHRKFKYLHTAFDNNIEAC
ncbi:hypothetical protein LCGC14_0662560, partial [marine sediment metagenome]